MTTDKLRFAIIGLDHWYTAIDMAAAMMSHPRVDLVGVADTDINRAREVAEKIGLSEYTDDLQKYIRDDAVQAIGSFITVDRNPEIVIAAASAGKNVVSIKPFARMLEEGTRIVEAVRESGIVFMPAESNPRNSDLNLYLKKLIDDGRLGRVVSGTSTLMSSLPQGWPDAPFDGGWWADPDKVPGGGWIDHAIYQVDKFRWLLGEKVVRVTGRTANLVHKELAVEDYGHAIVEFESGATFAIEDTWSGPADCWRTTSMLVGTEAAVGWDTMSPDMLTFGLSDTPGWVSEPAPADDSSALDPMIDHLQGNAQAIYGTVEDAWENLAVGLAFYESAETGRPVEVQRL